MTNKELLELAARAVGGDFISHTGYDEETIALKSALKVARDALKVARDALNDCEGALDECRDYPITYDAILEALAKINEVMK